MKTHTSYSHHKSSTLTAPKVPVQGTGAETIAPAVAPKNAAFEPSIFTARPAVRRHPPPLSVGGHTAPLGPI